MMMMMIKGTLFLVAIITLVFSVVVDATTSTAHSGGRNNNNNNNKGGGGGGGVRGSGTVVRQRRQELLLGIEDEDPPIGITTTTATTTTVGDEEDPPPIGTTTTTTTTSTTTTTTVVLGDATTAEEDALVGGTSTIGGDVVPGPLLVVPAPTRNASDPNALRVNATDDEYTILEGHELRTDSSSETTDNRRSLLANDTSPAGGSLFVSAIYESTDFEGDLRVDSDGDVRYDPPDNNFLGTETFIYTACLTRLRSVCNNATVRIHVDRDPDKPTTNPRANNKDYDVNEGETLRVDDPGFLENDSSGNPQNPLRVCDVNSGESDSYEGRFDVDDRDGSFEYRAPRCYTGTESFSYRACYRDYPDMESGTAFVNVRVRDNPDRPPRPQANDDRYTVLEGETLDVHEYEGLLENDNGRNLYVRSRDKSSGFVGNLEVDRDGGFKYTSRSGGGLRTYEFTYEICSKDWEDWDCVGCDEATVRIEVQNNPNKPQTAPVSRSTSNRMDIAPGERLRASVVGDVEYDPRYNLRVTDYQTDVGFQGILNTGSDGTFEYGNSPVGDVSTFTYSICYQEWPDVCSVGSVTITTGFTDSLGRLAFPALEEVGNDGEPADNFPLLECQSDCDDDKECAGDLICMIREGSEVVPGCTTSDGVEIEDFDGRDFCIQPSNTTLKVVGNDGDPKELYPLSECQADCDSDLECRDDLICFERDGMENVPGCDGDKDSFDGRDFCVTGMVALNRNGGRRRFLKEKRRLD